MPGINHNYSYVCFTLTLRVCAHKIRFNSSQLYFVHQLVNGKPLFRENWGQLNTLKVKRNGNGSWPLIVAIVSCAPLSSSYRIVSLTIVLIRYFSSVLPLVRQTTCLAGMASVDEYFMAVSMAP